MTVSIIIPVYNAQTYLRECVDSALSQTYSDVEIVLVDDGSTDSSAVICDDYAAAHANIKVAHTQNGGLSFTRNNGLDIATGQYITFLDADDMLHPRSIELMMQHASTHDIVNARTIRAERCKWVDISHPKTTNYKPSEAIKATLYQDKLNNSACGKLYPAHIFEAQRFTNGLWYEDLDIMYRLMENIDGKVIDIDAPLYFYRKNPGSFINSFDHRRLDVLKVVDTIEEHYANDPEMLKAAQDRKFSANCNMFILTSKAGLSNEADKCWQVIRALRWQVLTDPSVRLKNKAGALLSYLGKWALTASSTIS